MKRWISLLLLLGAMVGLFGQAAAYASIPAPTASSPAIAGMSEECMQMMARHTEPEKKPCTGITLDCIAAMGCTVPLTLVEPFVLPVVAPIAAPVLAISSARPLEAHSSAPEPEPPSLI